MRDAVRRVSGPGFDPDQWRAKHGLVADAADQVVPGGLPRAVAPRAYDVMKTRKDVQTSIIVLAAAGQSRESALSPETPESARCSHALANRQSSDTVVCDTPKARAVS
jgi:hypothetical protein